MTSYNNYCASIGKVSIQPICKNDIEQIRNWRNSDRIRSTTLSKNHITKEMQNSWFLNLENRMDYVFKIQLNSTFIGVASSKIIDTKETIMQPSIYIGNSLYDGKGYGVSGIILINDFCFDFLNSSKLIINILKSNLAAIRFNESVGYKISSEEKGFVTYSLSPDDYYRSRNKIMKLIARI